MTFLHKLARRLARLKAGTLAAVAVVSAAAAIVGCEQPISHFVTPTVSRLVVSPQVVTLQPDQTQDFMAVGFTPTGDTAQVDVTWSASRGSLSDKGTKGGRHYGQYRNAQCGTSTVTATAHPGNVTGEASVTVTCPVVGSVTVTPPTASVPAGQTVQLTATPHDTAGNPLAGFAVTWSSSNTAAATVDANGLVSGVAAGSATITATSGGQSGTSSITVTTAAPVPVATVTVSPTSGTVVVGLTLPLTATLKDAAGNVLTGRTITWSSNSSAATVSPSGVVTGVAAGSATITATSEGQSGTSAVTVTAAAPPPVASVTVSPASGGVQVGQKLQLSVTLKDANNNVLTGRVVAWTSSSASATVDGSGLVTGVASGSATITATSEGKSGTAAITVTAPVVAAATVSVGDIFFKSDHNGTQNPAVDTIPVGGTVTWNWVGALSHGIQSTGSPSFTSSATLTGVGSQYSFTFNTAGTYTYDCVVHGTSMTGRVVVLAPVSSVTVSLASSSVVMGGTDQGMATLKDAAGNILTGRTVSWSSSNSSIASVNTSGLVTGVTAGSATITATSEGKSGSATITVTPVPVASVTVSLASPSVVVRGTDQATATLKDAAGNILTGRTVSWSSSNTSIASVSTSGLVTGVAAGTATITATSGGQSGSATITVTLAPVASVTVSLASASVLVGATDQATATLKDAGGNILTGRAVSWSSSNTSIASVNTSGLVTGVAAGTATITATSEGKSGSATITVTASSGGATFGHVFIVTEENTDYADAIGSSSMPYLNSLAQQYGLATQYYANTHPSIGNYFELATGQILTNDDNSSTIQTVDNVVRELLKAGKTWKSYAEDLPSVGYTGGDQGNYARKHNVFALLSDVVNNATQVKNLVPFTQFATDLRNGTLPSFSNIVPNLCNDAHDCSLGTADRWLSNNIGPLLSSATFQQDGLLIITFDEAGSDNANGGGKVAWVVVSPKAKRGYQSTTKYQHQSTLRLTLKALGVTVFPGAASGAPDMTEFFTP